MRFEIYRVIINFVGLFKSYFFMLVLFWNINNFIEILHRRRKMTKTDKTTKFKA